MKTDEEFMQMALKEAEAALAENEVPIGAVVVHNNKIISRAHNLTETLNDPTAHAEMLAITAATSSIGGKYLNECTLYVTVEPCVMCAGALAWSQISRIVYGCDDEKHGYSVFAPNILHPKTKVTRYILQAECKEMVQDFFRSKR